MTALYICLYILSCIFCFFAIVNYERKNMHIDKDALFFMMLFSALWPAALVIVLIFKLFEWIEKVVNKK